MAGLFLKILELSIVGSYVILFVLAARILLRKSPKWCSYVLWSVVFLRLILPVVPESNFSLVPARLKMPQKVVEGIMPDKNTVMEENQAQNNAGDYVATKPATAGSDAISSDMTNTHVMPVQDTLGGNAAYLETSGGLQPAFVPETPNEVNSVLDRQMVLQLATYIWLAGAVLFGGYHLVSYFRFKKHLKGAVQVETGVYEIPGRHVSFVLGMFKPAIYLSDSLDEESRRVVLCHEQVHLKRRDYLVKPLALGVCCLHWFNPLVWVSFYLMNRDCEMSCDEKVVSILGENSKKVYSYALLDEATRGERRKNKRENMCAVLSFGEESIKSRIKHVLHFKKAPVWVIGVSVVVLAVVIAGLCSNSKQSDADDTASEKTEQTEAAEEEYRKSLEETLKEWAVAFTNKDGNTLYELSYDKEAFISWDMITKLEDGYAFGYSSPWPWIPDYELHYEENAEEATIRYWMRSSAPTVYPEEEMVRIRKEDGLYYVDHQSMVSYASIDTKEEFEAAYTEYEADIRVAYSKEYTKNIFRHIRKGTNPEYYDAYKEPVSAAKLYLNLGEGTGEVTEILYQADSQKISGKGTYGVLGEGSIVNVTYTFSEDGSRIQIPMVLAEQSEGIWALSVGNIAEAKTVSRGALPSDADFMARKVKEEIECLPGIFYQSGDFGIYKVTPEAFELVYETEKLVNAVYHLQTDEQDANNVILYFPTDSLCYEGALDWYANSICKLNLTTGEKQYVPFEEACYMDEDTNFSVSAGFVFINNSVKDGIYVFPDAGEVWNGKNVAELSDAEENEYGRHMRAQVLEKAGTMVALGNRLEAGTVAVIDLDGDGISEKITLRAGAGENRYYPYDHYILRINDREENRQGDRLNNEIWAVSPDGQHIYIALYEEGASADPKTTFLKYEDGRLSDAGELHCNVLNLTIENGVIRTFEGLYMAG